MLRKKIFALLTMMLMVHPALSTVKISGVVIDAESGAPLTGAHIALAGSNWLTTTGTDGSFALLNIPGGEYTISATYIGYIPRKEFIVVHTGTTTIVNLALQPEAVGLPEVTVQVPAMEAIVYSSGEIRQSSASDLGTFLAQAGELTVLDGGGSREATISIRGAGSEQIAVYLDGHRLNDPRTGSVDLKSIPLNSLEKIVVRPNSDLTKGASSPGGAVELYTSTEEKKTLSFGLGSFSTNRYGLELSQSYSKYSAGFSYSHSQSAGDFKYRDPDTGIEEHMINDDSQTDNIFLKFSALPLPDIKWTASYHHLSSDRGAPGGIQNPDTLDRIKTEIDCLSGNLQILKKRWSNETRLSYFRTEVKNVDFFSWSGTNIDFSSNHNSIAAEAATEFTRRDSAGFFTAGAAYRLDQVESTTLDNPQDRHNLGFYLRRNFKFRDLSLTSTIRGDDYFIFGNFLSSNLQGRFNPDILDRSITLTAQWSRDFNLPTFNQLFWAENVFAAPNPDLQPERMENWDAGIEWNRPQFNARITCFQRDIKQLIVWRETVTTSGKKWIPVNLDAAEIKGVEFFGRVSGEHFRFSAAGTLCDPRNRSQAYDGSYLTFRPQVTTTETLTFIRGIIETSLSHRYVSQRYIVEANTKWEKAFSLFDAALNYKIAFSATEVEILFRVNNVFDKSYAIIRESPMPGRNYNFNLIITAGHSASR